MVCCKIILCDSTTGAINWNFPERSGGFSCFDAGFAAADPFRDDLLRPAGPRVFVVAPLSFGMIILLINR
jgi:hypothetical protein